MEYNPTCCLQTGHKKGDHRFVIEIKGDKMLFIIGLNPTEANENTPDPTIKKIMAFIQELGYSGVAVFNLSSERSINKYALSETLHFEYHKENLATMINYSHKYPTADVLLAFGNDIHYVRDYFPKCLIDTYNALLGHAGKFKAIANLTKKGNPRHPLYAKAAWGIMDFNIKEYIEHLDERK